MVRKVRFLGLFQTLLPEVLLAVDIGIARPGLFKEGLVDHGIEAFESRIGFFNMNNGGVAIERLSQGEGLHLTVDEDDPSFHPVRKNAPLFPSGPEALWAGGCNGVIFRNNSGFRPVEGSTPEGGV